MPVALVTGATRGIGKAAATALAEAGFDVAVTGRTQHEGDGRDDSDRGGGRPIPGSLAVTGAEIEACGVRALAVPMDLGVLASVSDAAARVLDAWGPVDVLVNNAVHTGAGSMTRLVDLDPDTLIAKLAANVVAPFALTQALLPAMLARGTGTIINVTSHVASNDPPAPAGEGGWGAGYAMSKASFHRMVGFLAIELAGSGIRAFNVDPGFVLTERMMLNQRALGFEGRFRGAPPSVPGRVIAWLAGGELGGITPVEADALNGTTIRAQKLALERSLHPDWR